MELVDIMRVARSTRVELMPEPHIHSEVEVNYLLDGRMTYLFGGEPLSVGRGQLAVFWGTVPHRVVAVDGPTSFVCLYLPIASFLAVPAGERFRQAVLGGRLVLARRTDALDASLFLRWNRDLETREPRRFELVRDELMGRLRRVDLEGWEDLPAAPSARPPLAEAGRLVKAQRMASYIVEHLDRPLSVGEIATAVDLHPNYAMAVFRRSLGLSLGQYVARQRLSHAQALLLSTDRDVTRIAFDCGFGSLSRFYEVFRAQVGLAPAAYRRRHRSP